MHNFQESVENYDKRFTYSRVYNFVKEIMSSFYTKITYI